jgi:hypothetical protein
MSLKHDLKYNAPTAKRAVPVRDLMKQVELVTGIRKRIREGYYTRPEVLADIARQLHRRVDS